MGNFHFYSGDDKITQVDVEKYILSSVHRLSEEFGDADRVAIMCTDNAQCINAILSLVHLEKEIVLLNPTLPAVQLEGMLDSISVTKIISDELGATKLQAKYDVISVEKFLPKDSVGQHDFESPNSILILLQKLRVIIYTSGTLGLSKAVALSYNQLISAYNNSNEVLQYSDEDVWLLSLPLFQISGFSILFRALISGASLVVPGSFATDSITNCIERFDITHLSFVPTQLRRVMACNCRPPKSLKYTLLGGASCDNALVSESIHAGWQTCKVYGSTETSAFVTILLPNEAETHIDSSGKALPNVRISINNNDESGRGEIVVNSDSISKGYLNSQKETEKKFISGNYLTGDYGYISDAGYLHVLNRLDDIIISGGQKIVPADAESVLMKLSGVLSCKVFGIHDAEWGESVTALIVSDGKLNLGIEPVKEELRKYLAPYQIPKNIAFITGDESVDFDKIKKSELIEMFNTHKK